MKEHCDQHLDDFQVAALRTAIHEGSAEASRALGHWIGRPSVIEFDSLERLTLAEATSVFDAGEPASDQTVCFCACAMTGILTGEIILVFDDASGMALADLVLDEPTGSTQEWTEMAISAALETTNILCCAFFNSLVREFVRRGNEETSVLLPSPPRFSREYAQSLMEFALMGQAMASDQVLLAQTKFEIDGESLRWTLLFIPDAASMAVLPKLIPAV